MSGGTWRGHDRQRDLPMLGIDPDAKSDWEPVDNGVRPDNRGPEQFTQLDGVEGNGGHMVGARPDIGYAPDHFDVLEDIEGDGRALMEYQRVLAQSYEDARTAKDAVLREHVG